MTRTRKRKTTKVQKPQRTLRKLWVDESSNFAVIHINNGTEGFNYFVEYRSSCLTYQLKKLVPNTNTFYYVRIQPECTCTCESFKQCKQVGEGTCKHIDALLVMR